MPGIHVVCDMKGNLKQAESRIQESIASLMHYDWYKQNIVYNENGCFLGYTNHETYPIKIIDDNELLVCIEGLTYGKPLSKALEEVKSISESVFNRSSDYRERIAKWQLDTDGDFLVLVLDKSANELCIINDALGRLPLYYCMDGDRIIVSREIRFIANLTSKLRFDREAIAQYMLFGYPLGKKTLFDNIFRLAPASVISASTNRSDISVERAHRFNFEAKDLEKSDPREQAAILIELYCEACRNRLNPEDSNVVTLSGGLDSRVVAGALKRLGAAFSNATFVDYFKYFDPDVDLARQIAEILGYEWKLFAMGPPTGEDVLKLLKIKNGLNFFGMSFSVPLFEAMREYYGDRITLFTGDGGDRLLPDLRPLARLRNVDALAEYIIEYYTFVPLDIVSAVTGMSKQEILTNFKEHLMTFEEKAMKLKFVNFMILERNFKWLFEGEDRNRYYSWPVAPFYSIGFFTHAMSCPDKIKERHKFYREVLVQLSPEVAAIDNAKWHFPITSWKLDYYYFAQSVFYSLPPGIRETIKKRYKKRVVPYKADSNIVNCFKEQLENCKVISEYVSTGGIQKYMHKINKYDLDHIFTITSTIEEFLGDTSTIEKYSDVDLI